MKTFQSGCKNGIDELDIEETELYVNCDSRSQPLLTEEVMFGLDLINWTWLEKIELSQSCLLFINSPNLYGEYLFLPNFAELSIENGQAIMKLNQELVEESTEQEKLLRKYAGHHTDCVLQRIVTLSLLALMENSTNRKDFQYIP